MNNQPEGQRCKTCKYMIRGECKRNAPTTNCGGSSLDLWPQPRHDDWCAEWAEEEK